MYHSMSFHLAAIHVYSIQLVQHFCHRRLVFLYSLVLFVSVGLSVSEFKGKYIHCTHTHTYTATTANAATEQTISTSVEQMLFQIEFYAKYARMFTTHMQRHCHRCAGSGAIAVSLNQLTLGYKAFHVCVCVYTRFNHFVRVPAYTLTVWMCTFCFLRIKSVVDGLWSAKMVSMYTFFCCMLNTRLSAFNIIHFKKKTQTIRFNLIWSDWIRLHFNLVHLSYPILSGCEWRSTAFYYHLFSWFFKQCEMS